MAARLIHTVQSRLKYHDSKCRNFYTSSHGTQISVGEFATLNHIAATSHPLLQLSHCRLNVASCSHGCNCYCDTVWRTVTAVLCACCHNLHAPHLCLTSSHTPESTQWDTTMAFLMRREAYDVLHTSRSPPPPRDYTPQICSMCDNGYTCDSPVHVHTHEILYTDTALPPTLSYTHRSPTSQRGIEGVHPGLRCKTPPVCFNFHLPHQVPLWPVTQVASCSLLLSPAFLLPSHSFFCLIAGHSLPYFLQLAMYSIVSYKRRDKTSLHSGKQTNVTKGGTNAFRGYKERFSPVFASLSPFTANPRLLQTTGSSFVDISIHRDNECMYNILKCICAFIFNCTHLQLCIYKYMCTINFDVCVWCVCERDQLLRCLLGSVCSLEEAQAHCSPSHHTLE